MSRSTPISEDMLYGYADGVLEPEAAARVEAWLAAHPERASEIDVWRRQNEAMHALFDPIAGEPLPARLMPREIARRRAATRLDRRVMAAAAVVLVAAGVGAGWFGHALIGGESTERALIDGAVAAHALYVRESRHAVEVPGDQKDHLDTWLSNRLARPIDAPDLTGQGFSLVGGRLLPPLAEADTGPAAQLMYQNAEAERVTVYVTANPPEGGRAFDVATVSGLDAIYWANDRITCTVVGQLPPDRMRQVASLIYHQLTWKR